MELKDFIQKSLLDIEAGLRGANMTYKKTRNSKDNAFNIYPTGDNDQRTIHFEIAVTTRSEKKGGGKAGGKVYVAEMQLGGEVGKVDENVSRISFNIAIGHFLG